MEERIWKYVSAVLALLLALSVVSVVVLYYQVKTPTVPINQPTVVETANFTPVCGINTTEIEVAKLEDQIEFLRGLISNKSGTGIAVVPIFGIIDDSTALQVIPLLRNLATNDSIGGVLLWIESPGGFVGPVMNIYSEVKKLSLIKPVVAYTGGLMASGGYYIATGAREIVASPLAEVGSIGVIYVHYDLEKNYEMNGIKVDVFKTGKHKDMGAEWRDLTPEERKKIVEMVNAYFQAFLRAVSEGRNMSIEEVKNYSTGETWFAENVTGTLVDELGGMDTAIATLERLMNVSGARVVIYKDLETPEDFGTYGSTALYLDPRYLSAVRDVDEG